MGSNEEFGPDTETIRAWLDKRATYATDTRIAGRPRGRARTDPSPPATEVAPTPRKSKTPPGTSTAAAAPSGTPDSVDASRSVLAALGRDVDTERPASDPAPSRQGTADPAQSVVDALRDGPAAEPRSAKRPRREKAKKPAIAPKAHKPPKAEKPAKAPKPPKTPRKARRAPEPAAAPAPEVDRDPYTRPAPPPRVAVPAEVKVGRWTEPLDNLTAKHASTDVDFPVRAGVRRVLSVLLLLVLAATGVASYLAYQGPTTATTGVAGTLGFLTLVVWAIRAGTTTTHLSIQRGQLSVRRGGRTEVVDIASPYTPVAIVGEAGQRRWRVLIERTAEPLIVIHPGMVDAHWFTSALYRLRPELRPEAQEALRRAAAAGAETDELQDA